MSDPLMTWHRNALSARFFSGVEKVDRILDSQRRFATMLDDRDGDVFYSRTDLNMFIDRCREDARRELISLYCEIHGMDVDSAQDLVLHAAAELKISHRNTNQLIRDYGHLINHSHPEGPHSSLPLHLAVAARGANHLFRLEYFLDAYPEAVKLPDANGLLPVQIALIHGADFDVIKVLIDAYPPALDRPLLPRVVPDDLEPLVGMLPFHISCFKAYSLDVIFEIVRKCPHCVVPTNPNSSM